ncbi:dihydrofolate reductase [Nocardioides sp. GY 10127]|uniref:dihydrofolate reductase n=1 Tax=Nocardioides sp. GY 10127 TaxID=2569762 RepID=UPI0010A874D2|nr:dihydrofolate reductase [Nocardioides sp. GY 10127]TIC85575.1 dihydrofolate reductase [Nocardioides sp. GY 10127]
MPLPDGTRVVLVAAVARNGVIGHGPDIPWSLPGEQRTFKELTLGHTLLMGRTTYESIGRPLPGRTTVVLTRDEGWTPPPAPRSEEVLVVHDVQAALDAAAGTPGELMVAGGAAVYAALLPHADAQVLTEVPLEPVGDVRYPSWPPGEGWSETRREPFDGFTRVTYERD